MNKNIKRIVFMALMVALGYLLMFLQVPLLAIAPWLTIDFSFVVILLISLAYGNVNALIVAILINLLNYISVGSLVGLPVGQISNVLAILSYLVIFVYFQKKQQLIIGSIFACLTVTIIMFTLNYFWLTPWYFNILKFPIPDNFLWYCVSVIGLFNLLRWGIISVVNFLFNKLFIKLLRQM